MGIRHINNLGTGAWGVVTFFELMIGYGIAAVIFKSRNDDAYQAGPTKEIIFPTLPAPDETTIKHKPTTSNSTKTPSTIVRIEHTTQIRRNCYEELDVDSEHGLSKNQRKVKTLGYSDVPPVFSSTGL